jgi:Protein of unknown function (DUF3040)
MSLSPREREALSEIEGRLSRSDPRLAAMLSHWPDRRVREWPARLPEPARRRSPADLIRFLIISVGVTVVIVLAIVSILRTPAPRSPGRVPAHGSQQAPPSFYPYGTYP